MDKNGQTQVSAILNNIFQRFGQGFVRVTDLYKKLTIDEKTNLGLNRSKMTQKDIIKKLSSLPEPFWFHKKGGSYYLMEKSLQDVLLEHIAQKPGKTVGQICSPYFPLLKKDVVREVNALLRQGAILVQIRDTQNVPAEFHLGGLGIDQPRKIEPTPLAESVEASPGDPVNAFKEAYDQVGPGKHFVDIFEIRRQLKWSRDKFDQVLKQLILDGQVAPNLGNPGDLSREEVEDSYQDEYGDLYITVTWRGV